MQKLSLYNSLWLLLALNIPKLQTRGECYIERSNLRNVTLGITLTCSNTTIQNLRLFTRIFDFTNINLINSNLTSFDDKIIVSNNYSTLIRLNLDNDYIKSISKDSFKMFNNLKILILCTNEINNFEFLERLGSLRELSLQNNNISELTENFGNLPLLKVLDLSYNNLQTLGNATYELQALEQLYLNNNNISELEATFENNKALVILNLGSNQLQSLDAKMFAELEALQQLYLNDNLLDEIEDGAFDNLSNLRYLKLSNNKLQILSASTFRSLGNLEHLHLNDNLIKRIEPRSFSDLANLTFLDLRGNNIGMLENRTFTGLKQIISLNLTKLNIKEIQPGAFDGLDMLLTLDLNRNKIRTLEEHAFEGLTSLDNLQLVDNPLEIIKPNAFSSLSHLITLTIRNSNISVLKSNTFNKMPSLKTLEMTSSNLVEIQPGAFNSLSNLITLIIGNDYGALQLQNGTFQGLYKLTNMYLKNLHIKTINNEAFNGLNRLRNLYFQSCTVTNVTEGAFTGLSDLSVIKSTCNNEKPTENPLGKSYKFCNLSLTHIEAGALGDLYTQVTHLFTYNYLYLNHNKLTNLPENMFNKVSNIIELGLNNNRIQTIEPGAFNGLSFHQKPCSYVTSYQNERENKILLCAGLYLNNNTLKVLRNLTFYNVRNLVTLRLDYNVIEEIEAGTFDHLYFSDIHNNSGFLNTMYLNNNKLKNLRSNVFSKIVNLSNLHLENNAIESIEPNAFDGLVFPTNGLSDLEAVIYLNNNKLTTLLSNAFHGVKGVTKLRLNNNQVKEIQPGAFNGLFFSDVNLNYKLFHRNKIDINILDLSYNKLMVLRKKTFMGMLNVAVLNLNDNGIIKIEPTTFSDLTQLVVLKLSNNKIDNFAENQFRDLRNLQTLDLSNNRIFSVSIGTFTGLINIKQLLLNNNRIADVPLGTLNNLLSVENLQLGNNQLSKFKVGSFSKLERLKHLNLSHNNFAELNENVLYPLKNLELLDLDDNKLTYINHSSLLLHLPSLRFISINTNNWPCSILIQMIKSFRRERIYYLFNTTVQYTNENVDGILCTDIQETNVSDWMNQATEALNDLNTVPLNLSDVVYLLNNIDAKFDTLISQQSPDDSRNLSWVIENLLNFTKSNANLLSSSKDVVGQMTVTPEASGSNLDAGVTLNLTPLTTMFILLMCISSVTICLVLIMNMCNVQSKKGKKNYRVRKTRSEMELLDTAA